MKKLYRGLFFGASLILASSQAYGLTVIYQCGELNVGVNYEQKKAILADDTNGDDKSFDFTKKSGMEYHAVKFQERISDELTVSYRLDVDLDLATLHVFKIKTKGDTPEIDYDQKHCDFKEAITSDNQEN